MWDVGLAKMIKDRDNKNYIGPCIGKVISINPLKISILDGNIVLRKQQLYITQSLLEKEYRFILDANDGEITITSEPSNPLLSIKISDNNKTKLTLFFELNVEDEVLLIPSENESVYFIVDKIIKVGG